MSGPDFEKMLSGGHPNSLGRTLEVVDEVNKNPSQFNDLFECYMSDDEVVRLRASNAMKRIGKENRSLLIPYLGRFISQIALIDQASAQWTLAQIFLLMENDMSPKQTQKAKQIMVNNLKHHSDWIVLNQTMKTVTKWTTEDDQLRKIVLPELQRLTNDKRKSVSGTAKRMIAQLGEETS